jgi:hypothetical protein
MADDERDETPREPTAEAARKRRRAADADTTSEERERPAERAERRDPDPEPRTGERSSRLYRLGRRLLDRGDDVRDLASSVLESSDRAKTEMVRMVAREVRNYLDELKLKEDVMTLVRSHSLEFKISVHLAPLAPEAPAPAPPPAASAPEPRNLPAPIVPPDDEEP